MKNVINAELYKLRHDRLMWFVPVIYAAIGFYSCTLEHEVFDLYKGLELFSLSETIRICLPLAAAILTGYMVGGDFSRRTIQNALSAGVSQKHYYFSRLLVQMVLTGALFSITLLIHTAGHLLHPMGNADAEISSLGAKLAAYMAVALLELLAYVSVMNAVCYFVKKQLVAVTVGMGLVYAEIIIRQAAAVNGAELLRKIAEYAPSSALRTLFGYAVDDRIFTVGFLQFGISAAVIIAVSSIAGFVKFWYDMDIH